MSEFTKCFFCCFVVSAGRFFGCDEGAEMSIFSIDDDICFPSIEFLSNTFQAAVAQTASGICQILRTSADTQVLFSIIQAVMVDVIHFPICLKNFPVHVDLFSRSPYISRCVKGISVASRVPLELIEPLKIFIIDYRVLTFGQWNKLAHRGSLS